MSEKHKKSQVTIFIILAIVIVVVIGAYFVLRNGIGNEVPANMKPVYDYYLSCMQENTLQGIYLMEEQGGYIETPAFEPGSQYMPFSSQLNFFGQAIPYWMYVSGSNVLKEQVPTKAGMQREIANYVKNKADYCDFSDFEKQGYSILIEPGDATAEILDSSVNIVSKNKILIYFENQSVTVDEEKYSVDTKLGKFYNLALQTYNYEKQNMFLEKYAVDALHLYAPTTGVELSCAPKVFNEQLIKQDLVNAFAENYAMLKLYGDYYQLGNQQNKYFVTDIGTSVDENVNFIYSSNWPTRIEIYGDKVVNPVGLQEGLGILGFCYVPYHLIYDIDFPVLIQFYNEKEVFQFPVSVIIDKNQERNAIPSEAGVNIETEICKYKNQEVQVHTYDSELNPVPANIKFKCLNTECPIGKTIGSEDAVLNENFPQCVNGFIIASAEGYSEAKYQISTNTENVANIVMKKLYNLSISVNSDKNAIVSFNSAEYSTVVVIPESKNIVLPEGDYNVSVYIYSNSSLILPATSERKCIQVPKSGIGGVFGITEEQCFDVNLPKQDITYAVVGGGKSNTYLAESQLREAGQMNLKVQMFKTPSTLEQVQENYNLIDGSNVEVNLI